MANRTVKVDLLANVQGYVAGMDRAAAATRAMANDSVARLAQQRQAFDRLGRTALAVGVVVAAGVAIAVARFMEFDAAMSNVNAVTQETAENMDLLRAAALEAGGDTVFTATEAATAIEELGKAGLSTADILGGALKQSLALAASGQLEVARAAEITATTLKQYGLDGAQAGRVADVLSAAAGKALGSVEDLAQGLKFVGPVAASMGVSLEETAGALALFADQGLIGEQAGTSLRGVLSSLTSPSSQAAKEIHSLGINLYDLKTGAFLGLDNVADQLSNAFSNMDDKSRDAALGIIFGNQQITAARVLFEQGGDSLRNYTSDVSDAGYAARVAADRLDNLRGDLEKLGGAFDTVLIQQGSAANDSLRGLVQGLTFLVEVAGDAPPAAVNIGLVTAAIALAGGAAFVGVGQVVDFQASLKAAGVTARGAALSIGLTTAALTLLVVVISAATAQAAESKAYVDGLADSYETLSGAATEYTRDIVVQKAKQDGLFDSFAAAGISQEELTDAMLGSADAIDIVQKKIEAYGDTPLWSEGDNYWVDEAAGAIVLKQQLDGLLSQREESIKVWQDETAANASATAASEENADALAALEGQAGDTSGAIDELSEQILNFGKATLDTRDAERKFQAAIDDVTASVEAHGATLNLDTEEGRANESALDDLAEASLKRASAILIETSSQEDATAAVQAGRDALIVALGQFDITGQAAEEYADKLGLIPSEIGTAARLTGVDEAAEALQRFYDFWNGKSITFRAATSYAYNSGSVGGIPRGFASGGYTGDGPTDEEAGVVHKREFVTNDRATSIPANRAALEYMNSGGNIAGWSGGYMTASTSTTNDRRVQVDMQVVSDDPYVTGELVKQQLAAKLATLG